MTKLCTLDAMVSKTDILDQFWDFSIKHVVFPKATFFPSWFYRPAHELKHSDITLIEECQTDQVYQFSYHGVQGAHKIQLLTYSCNVQRAVEVELSLKSKRESEKEKGARQSTFNVRHNTT